MLKLNEQTNTLGVPGGLAVKDTSCLLLWHVLDTWPRERSHAVGEAKKKKRERQTSY